MDMQSFLNALGSDIAIVVYLSVAVVAASVLLFFLIRKKKENQQELERKIKEKKETDLEDIIQNKRGGKT